MSINKTRDTKITEKKINVLIQILKYVDNVKSALAMHIMQNLNEQLTRSQLVPIS